MCQIQNRARSILRRPGPSDDQIGATRRANCVSFSDTIETIPSADLGATGAPASHCTKRKKRGRQRARGRPLVVALYNAAGRCVSGPDVKDQFRQFRAGGISVCLVSELNRELLREEPGRFVSEKIDTKFRSTTEPDGTRVLFGGLTGIAVFEPSLIKEIEELESDGGLSAAVSVSERVLRLSLKKVSFVAAYGPCAKTGRSDDDLDAFDQALTDAVAACEKRTALFVGGDLNCNIGDAAGRRNAGVVTNVRHGPFGLGATNDRGRSILQALTDLPCVNTYADEKGCLRASHYHKLLKEWRENDYLFCRVHDLSNFIRGETKPIRFALSDHRVKIFHFWQTHRSVRRRAEAKQTKEEGNTEAKARVISESGLEHMSKALAAQMDACIREAVEVLGPHPQLYEILETTFHTVYKFVALHGPFQPEARDGAAELEKELEKELELGSAKKKRCSGVSVHIRGKMRSALCNTSLRLRFGNRILPCRS